MNCAKDGSTNPKDLYAYDVFPGQDVGFASIVDNAAYLQGPILRNSHLWGVNGHFQPNLADCGSWMVVHRLQVDRFLPIVGEMFSANSSVIHYP